MQGMPLETSHEGSVHHYSDELPLLSPASFGHPPQTNLSKSSLIRNYLEKAVKRLTQTLRLVRVLRCFWYAVILPALAHCLPLFDDFRIKSLSKAPMTFDLLISLLNVQLVASSQCIALRPDHKYPSV